MPSFSEKVLVEMSPQDAGLFLIFQEHYKQFGFLTASGIWDVRRGSATINFDHEGAITSVKRELYTYPTGLSTPRQQ